MQRINQRITSLERASSSGAVLAAAATWQGGAYTPTFTGVNLGSTGTNVAQYVFVGGPNSGDRGIMSALGQWVLGGTGFSVTSPVDFSLPPGFTTPLTTNSPPIAVVTYQGPGGTEYQGFAYIVNSSSRLQLYHWGVSGALISRALISGTAPFTWAAGHFCRWSVTLPMVRA